MSAIALFSHIEQQLNALRAKTLKDLEEKVITPSPAAVVASIVPHHRKLKICKFFHLRVCPAHHAHLVNGPACMQAREREDQLQILSGSYLRLKGDFEYNVQLLDGRDAELAQRHAELAQSAGEQEKQALACKQLQGKLSRAHEGATFTSVSSAQTSCSTCGHLRHYTVLCVSLRTCLSTPRHTEALLGIGAVHSNHRSAGYVPQGICNSTVAAYQGLANASSVLARAEAKMQQALLQQAEAVWQAQHDRLASELGEARGVGEDALAAALAQQAEAVKATQVASPQSMRLLIGTSVPHAQHHTVTHTGQHNPCAGASHPPCLAQSMSFGPGKLYIATRYA